jgi:tetratricopeptide (TPR) repeat protein
MTYVGNEALSPQIQERIQNTFQQTIGLAEEGNRQEALLGCDFILRLDPLFEPARLLQERLNEGEGPVEIGNLNGSAIAEDSIPEASVDIGELIADAPDEAPLVGDFPTEVEPPELELPLEVAPVELTTEGDPEIALTPADEMSLEVEPLQTAPDAMDLAMAETEDGETPVVAELATRMAMLLEQRNFQNLMALAMENQDQITGNPDLQRMVGLANERLEAEPYVRNFLESAQAAKQKGDLDSARSHLEKARELDPSHPDLSGLEADIEAGGRVEPPVSFEPPPMIEVPLEEVPPLIESEGADEIAGEVDEFFASVETPAAEATADDTTIDQPEPELEPAAIDEPKPVPTLDAEPSARLDSESEQRIDDLLNEGQVSFETGQFQTAIDAWSRIFLIDIDHAEASRRIELARKLKGEVERQTEEAFHEGITKLESGDEEKAKEAFNNVLEMQPNHMGARDFLEKIESGDLSVGGGAVPELAPVAEAAPESETAETPPEDHGDLTPTPTPGPTVMDEFEATEPEFEPVPGPAPRKRSFALIGSAVLILLLAVSWFVYSNWDRFFPASGPGDSATSAQPQADPIERAREFHEAGNTAMAINVLRRLLPGSDKYAEAQALIASWEAGGQPADVQPSDEPSEELLAQRDELLTQARQAISRGEHLLAMDLLDQAHGIQALEEDQEVFKNQATVALEFLREERDLFDQGDWEYALPNLWRMRDNNPDNPDVIRLMIDCYYNLGLRDLQRGDAKSALEKFEEAKDLAGGDEDLDRLAQFSSAYAQRPADMLYRIFVKYQRFR